MSRPHQDNEKRINLDIYILDSDMDKLNIISKQENISKPRIIKMVMEDFLSKHKIKEDGTIEYIGTDK